MSCWYLPAKKYVEISPSRNITFKSAAGISHMPANGDWESPGATEWSFSRLHSALLTTLIG
jgi:hypothetical protein